MTTTIEYTADNLKDTLLSTDNIETEVILLVSSGSGAFMPRPAIIFPQTKGNIIDSYYGLCAYDGQLCVFHGVVANRLGPLSDAYFGDVKVVDTTNIRHTKTHFGNLGWDDDTILRMETLIQAAVDEVM